jgi:transglutaminase-like putative cysteine protease
MDALSSNSMTWEDDRRAAAFVSGRDATAQRFARLVKTAVRNNLRKDIPENVQYAAAIFGALKAFGINYVVDPSSAFTDNVGTAAVDFLQFPYQTLLYHGGDCDDLTILNCSLLEALGIETAFMTVPGHIYMAFDSGLSADKIGSVRKGYYIAAEGKLWVPVEITLSQDTFSLAWSLYLQISVPDSDVNIDMPSQDILIKHFTEARYY